MVLPEGAPTHESQRSRAPRLAGVGLAAAVLFAGILALGQATSPPDEAVVALTESTITFPGPLISPTTTLDVAGFSIAQITTGRRFFWIKAPPSGRLWPIDLITHGGQVYLFGSQQMSISGSAGVGLSAWVSADGVRWQPLGQILDDAHEITRVVSTGPGLVALGSRIADGAPMIWTSASGIDWTRAELPQDGREPGTTIRLSDAAVFKGHLRVVGARVPDLTIDVLSNLPEDLMGPEPRSVRLGFEVRGDVNDGIVHVYGPLGLHAFSMKMGELDLDPSLERRLIGPDPPTRQFIWSLSQEVGWSSAEIASSAVQDLWVSPDGLLIAYGSGSGGSTISTSNDGVTWVTHGRSSRAWIFDIGARGSWQGSLIGSGVGEDLFASPDGVSWERIGTGEVLPDEIGWDLGPVGSGPAGLATVAGYVESGGASRIEPVTFQHGDAELTLDIATGSLWVARSGYEPLEVPLWVTGAEAHYIIDFIQSSVTFTDPGSGAELVTVGFSTLEGAMSTAMAEEAITERALLFTADGETWSVQELSNVVSDAHEIDHVAVLHDRVLILTRDRVVEGDLPPRTTIFVGQIDP